MTRPAQVPARIRHRLSAFAIVPIALAAIGCWGEPEPLRIKDPERARSAMLKKTGDPDRPPGFPKSADPVNTDPPRRGHSARLGSN
jgi:hypothetical protein